MWIGKWKDFVFEQTDKLPESQPYMRHHSTTLTIGGGGGTVFCMSIAIALPNCVELGAEMRTATLMLLYVFLFGMIGAARKKKLVSRWQYYSEDWVGFGVIMLGMAAFITTALAILNDGLWPPYCS